MQNPIDALKKGRDPARSPESDRINLFEKLTHVGRRREFWQAATVAPSRNPVRASEKRVAIAAARRLQQPSKTPAAPVTDYDSEPVLL